MLLPRKKHFCCAILMKTEKRVYFFSVFLIYSDSISIYFFKCSVRFQ